MHKNNTIKGLCFFALFVFAGFGANAQLTHLEQSVYLNFNAATAQFNDDVAANIAGDLLPMTRFNAGKNAGLGVGLGYRVSYRFDVGFGEVSPYIHADFQWNRVKGDMRDQYMNANDGNAPNYFNIPIYAGVNYRYQLTEIFTPFAEFGIGPDFFMITKETGSTIACPNFKLRYQTTCNVAWQIGLGSFFGQHVSAGLHYSGYGKHAVKYTSATEVPTALVAEDAADTKTQTRSVGLFSLRIGFHF